MKTQLATIFAFVSFASASMACQPEAQIISKVGKVLNKDYSGCVVSVDLNQTSHFQSSQVCPLQIEDVLSSGVKVGLKNGHDCQLEAGDDLTGILVQTNNGIILEK